MNILGNFTVGTDAIRQRYSAELSYQIGKNVPMIKIW